jgi:repressor LexA
MQTRTRRQRDVLEFISRYIDSHGFEPSYQLIARHLGITSKAAIAKHVRSLEKQGLLKTRNDKGQFTLEVVRTFEPVSRDEEIDWVASANNTSQNGDHSPFSLPAFLLGPYSGSNILAFRVPDSAMEADGICQDDIALIQTGRNARDGDLVVAAIKTAPILLRRHFRSGAKIELRSSDPNIKPFLFPADKVKVLGIYRGLLRPAR